MLMERGKEGKYKGMTRKPTKILLLKGTLLTSLNLGVSSFHYWYDDTGVCTAGSQGFLGS